MLELGEFGLECLDRTVTVEGETPRGAESVGRGELFAVEGPEGLRLTLRDVRWGTGERDIVAVERHESPERFDTLVERLRLAVLDYRGPYIELRQVRLKANGRGNLFNADLRALDEGAGVDVSSLLIRHGASEVGTRDDLLGDEGRTRARVGARFPESARLLPVIAYVVTRVAPVARRVAA